MINSPSRREGKMRRFLCSKLKALGVDTVVDKSGNIYATKGSAEHYPCVVAHMDEVHQGRSNGFSLQMIGDDIIFGFDSTYNSFCGIGADDKNGLWVALKAIEVCDVIKCAFFVGEEIGCYGSSRADISFFDDCRYVIECDRRGGSDMITEIEFNELCSKEFICDVNHKKFGYRLARGMMTDVLTLKQRGLSVCCVNLSCGYYNPHTDCELTRISELTNCLNFTIHIIKTCNKIYPHTQKPKEIWNDNLLSIQQSMFAPFYDKNQQL